MLATFFLFHSFSFRYLLLLWSAVPLQTLEHLNRNGFNMSEENALKWLVSSGGWYDETAMGLQEYPGMGLGAVALRDIEVCLPRPAFPMFSKSYHNAGRNVALHRTLPATTLSGTLGPSNPPIECRLEGTRRYRRLDSSDSMHDVGRCSGC
jgi:hypothetical protein